MSRIQDEDFDRVIDINRLDSRPAVMGRKTVTGNRSTTLDMTHGIFNLFFILLEIIYRYPIYFIVNEYIFNHVLSI
jgi:hypothetical protein